MDGKEQWLILWKQIAFGILNQCVAGREVGSTTVSCPVLPEQALCDLNASVSMISNAFASKRPIKLCKTGVTYKQ